MCFLRTIVTNEDSYTLYSFDSSYNDTPEIYQKEYDLNEIKRQLINCKMKHGRQLERELKKKKIPFHAMPFLLEDNTGFIFKCGKEVESCYQEFSCDHPTKLHISIPMEIDSNVLIVLQITSSEENALGSKENVKKIINSFYS